MDEQTSPHTEPNSGDRLSVGLPWWARIVILAGFFSAVEFEGVSAFYNGVQTGDPISLGFGVVGIPAGGLLLYSVLKMPTMRRSTLANLRERRANVVEPEPWPGARSTKGKFMGVRAPGSISSAKVGARWVIAAMWVTCAVLWWVFEPQRPLWMRLATALLAVLAVAHAVRLTRVRAAYRNHTPD